MSLSVEHLRSAHSPTWKANMPWKRAHLMQIMPRSTLWGRFCKVRSKTMKSCFSCVTVQVQLRRLWDPIWPLQFALMLAPGETEQSNCAFLCLLRCCLRYHLAVLGAGPNVQVGLSSAAEPQPGSFCQLRDTRTGTPVRLSELRLYTATAACRHWDWQTIMAWPASPVPTCCGRREAMQCSQRSSILGRRLPPRGLDMVLRHVQQIWWADTHNCRGPLFVQGCCLAHLRSPNLG